jgi:hypothetical protein
MYTSTSKHHQGDSQWFCFVIKLTSERQTRSKKVLICDLWSVWFYHIFPCYHIKGKIFGKYFEYKMCFLIFSTNFVWNIFRPKKNSARYYYKFTKYSRKVHIIFVRFWSKLFFSKCFQKIFIYQISRLSL